MTFSLTQCERLFETLQYWMARFHKYDAQSRGHVPVSAIKKLFTDIGHNIRHKTRDTIASLYGGSDGQISAASFITCAARIQIVIDRHGMIDWDGLEEDIDKALVM